jgi:hypothetical protein
MTAFDFKGQSDYEETFLSTESDSEAISHKGSSAFLAAPRARKRIIIKSNSDVVSPNDRKRYTELRDAWKAETMFVSSSSEIYFNRNYQRIIGMGSSVLPLIRKDLLERNGDWSWALACITNKDLVPKEKWGDYEEERKIWLAWLDKKHERGS